MPLPRRWRRRQRRVARQPWRAADRVALRLRRARGSAAPRAQFTAQEPEDIFEGLAEATARASRPRVGRSKKFAAEFPPLARGRWRRRFAFAASRHRRSRKAERVGAGAARRRPLRRARRPCDPRAARAAVDRDRRPAPPGRRRVNRRRRTRRSRRRRRAKPSRRPAPPRARRSGRSARTTSSAAFKLEETAAKVERHALLAGGGKDVSRRDRRRVASGRDRARGPSTAQAVDGRTPPRARKRCGRSCDGGARAVAGPCRRAGGRRPAARPLDDGPTFSGRRRRLARTCDDDRQAERSSLPRGVERRLER